MSMHKGLESRYADRFRGYVGTSDASIRNADNARKNADALRTAAGIVETQRENIDDLFSTAEMMVKMIDNHQQESGLAQVKNIPLPGNSIKESFGKKLGYVKLAMNFVSAGLLHFMKMTIDMSDDIASRDAIIRQIADNRVDIPMIGRLTEVDFDDVAGSDPIVNTKDAMNEEDSDFAPEQTKISQPGPAPPATPPKTPQQGKKLPVKPSSPIPVKGKKP